MAHIGSIGAGKIAVGDKVRLEVDYYRRLPIAANHTSTHQLNLCLRRVLQDEKPDHFMEVHQKGSLVTDEILRFDFSYNTKLATEDIARVEVLLNEAIAKNYEVFSKEVSLDEAKQINGLRQMFGEKYPDPVSVVCVGKSSTVGQPQSGATVHRVLRWLTSRSRGARGSDSSEDA